MDGVALGAAVLGVGAVGEVRDVTAAEEDATFRITRRLGGGLADVSFMVIHFTSLSV